MSIRFQPAAALVFLAAALGCGSKSSTAGVPANPAQAKQKAIASKLSTMTPAQRTAYLQQHPEAAADLTGVSNPND